MVSRTPSGRAAHDSAAGNAASQDTTAHPRTAPAPRRSTLLIVSFVVYLVLLAWIVLWKLAVPSIGAAAFLPHPIKWIPFVATAEAGASAPLEVVANVALFVPFGLYLRLLAPGWRLWAVAAVLLGTSLLFETTQHVLSIGNFDVTDVIDNTAGGLLGIAVVALARRRSGHRADRIMRRVLLVGTAVALVAAIAFHFSPLRYQDRQDVVVPLPGSSRVP